MEEKILNQHIKDRYTKFESPELTPEEQKRLQFEGLEEVIYKRMISTKFRKKSFTEEQESAIRQAIHSSVSKQKPLIFTHSFGAYKIWRVPSFPNPDWAEFISLAWFFKYASYVCGAYPPGVEYQFLSQDCCIKMLDNYPEKFLDQYQEGFLSLFNFFKPYLPKNLNITFTRLVPDLYTQKEYDHALKETVEEMKKSEPLSEDRVQELIESFKFNTLLDGDQDLTKLSKEKLIERHRSLAYEADGVLLTPKNVEFETGKEKVLVFEIPLVPEVMNSIAIGSSAASKTLHWAGTGIFEYSNGKFFDRVLSPTQYDKFKNQLREFSVTEKIPGMPTKVLVFEGRLNFL